MYTYLQTWSPGPHCLEYIVRLSVHLPPDLEPWSSLPRVHYETECTPTSRLEPWSSLPRVHCETECTPTSRLEPWSSLPRVHCETECTPTSRLEPWSSLPRVHCETECTPTSRLGALVLTASCVLDKWLLSTLDVNVVATAFA